MRYRRPSLIDLPRSQSLAASSFYPCGEDKGTAAPNDQTKFATYTRDSATGLDYAMNRYYSNTLGRFMSPDPYGGSASWAYDNEGKMNSVTYPSVFNHSGTYNTSYDSMARPSTLVDSSSNTWASNVAYGPANELLTLNTESRTYNSLLQLTSIAVTSGSSTVFSQQYVYPAGTIWSRVSR